MEGADIALCCATCNGGSDGWGCRDSYALSESYPVADTQQDWTFVSSSIVDVETKTRRTELSRLGTHPLPPPPPQA